jgi:hypothetical protein
MKSEGSTKVSTSTKKTDIFKNALDETQKMKLFQLLDDWEEPEQQIVDVVSAVGFDARMAELETLRCSVSPLETLYGSGDQYYYICSSPLSKCFKSYSK